MKRGPLLWWALFAVLAVIVAIGVLAGSGRSGPGADGGMPTVAPGSDVLDGVTVVQERIRGEDYRRAAFGDAWDDDNNAPGGRNGCDTRNDILTRDLDDKTHVSTKRCPQAVATGLPLSVPAWYTGPRGASWLITSRVPPKAASGMPPPMTLPNTLTSGLKPGISLA